MMNAMKHNKAASVVFNNDLQAGLDAAMRKIAERHAKYPLTGGWSVIGTLRMVAQRLKVNIDAAEALFGDAVDRDGCTWTAHDHFCGFMQLATYPGHILSEYTQVEELAVHRLFAAIHLLMFECLPQCKPGDGDLSREHGCQMCRKSDGASYGCVQRIAWAARDGHLDPSYVPPTPDEVHEQFMRDDFIWGTMYRNDVAKGETPYYKTAAAWLRYNGTVPAHLQLAS